MIIHQSILSTVIIKYSNLAVAKMCPFLRVCPLLVFLGFSVLPEFPGCCRRLLGAGSAPEAVPAPLPATGATPALQHRKPQPLSVSWLSFPCTNGQAGLFLERMKIIACDVLSSFVFNITITYKVIKNTVLLRSILTHNLSNTNNGHNYHLVNCIMAIILITTLYISVIWVDNIFFQV